MREEMKRTIEYYDKNSDAFVKSTVNVDFSEAQNVFLDYIKDGGAILDFGCGSGRDTKYFLNKGYKVSACDGSESMCRAASIYTGIEVKHMYFDELDSKNQYDGIWACSSILHLNRDELDDVIIKIKGALKSCGVMYASFKYGDGEKERNGRFFTDMNEELVKEWIDKAGMKVLKVWISSDVRDGRENERWINVVAGI